jgi:hypothetical protein
MLLGLYYRTWLRSPYFTDGLIGFGFYGLSEQGRRRFGEFPATMAEDSLIQNLFERDERCIDDDGWFTPAMPARVNDLLKVQIRQIAAHRDLTRFAAESGIDGAPPARSLGWLGREVRDPRNLPSVATFVAGRAISELGAMRRMRRPESQVWTRDGSSHG